MVPPVPPTTLPLEEALGLPSSLALSPQMSGLSPALHGLGMRRTLSGLVASLDGGLIGEGVSPADLLAMDSMGHIECPMLSPTLGPSAPPTVGLGDLAHTPSLEL